MAHFCPLCVSWKFKVWNVERGMGDHLQSCLIDWISFVMWMLVMGLASKAEQVPIRDRAVVTLRRKKRRYQGRDLELVSRKVLCSTGIQVQSTRRRERGRTVAVAGGG